MIDRRVDPRVHLVGIGGAGLSGLARIYLEEGYRVSGSDTVRTPALEALARAGARIHHEHSRRNIDPATRRVVISAAIPPANPEWTRARRLGIPVEKFSVALGALLNRREGVAVAGTHGKTTVSAWVVDLVRRAGRDVGYLIGARPLDAPRSAHLGSDPLMVCEACEYDRSFLNLRPLVALINNIEEDHLDYYSGLDEIRAAFREFALRTKPGGVVIAPSRVLRTLELPEDAPLSRISAGLEPQDRVRAERVEAKDGTYEFSLFLGARDFGRVRLSLHGLHNVRNALSAAAVGFACGIEPRAILESLREFRGVTRRMERIGTCNGAVVLDDYAHHPTEVEATVRAAREAFPRRRIFALFQPHQYSRTRRFLDRYATSFDSADRVLITEVYRARERLDRRVSGAQVVDRLRARGAHARFVPDLGSASRLLRRELGSGDLLVTMGAGNVTEVSHDLVA